MLSRSPLEQSLVPEPARQGFVDMQRRVEDIRRRFLDRLPDRYYQITTLCRALDSGQGGAEAIDGIAERAHKIAGVADTLGYPELGARSAVADRSLSEMRTARDWENARPAVRALVDEIARTIRQSG